MIRIKKFIKTTLLGGLAVILPVVLTYYFLRWIIVFANNLIAPMTKILNEKNPLFSQIYIAHIIVVTSIIAICFFIGLAVSTRFGKFIFHTIEKRILKIAPGYTLFKETIKQFLGQERAPFSRVALIRAYSNNTLMTGFITDEHPDGYYTVYVPSGLNPTTGLIFHLEKQYVDIIDASVEETMRSIIGCGSGSHALIDKWIRKQKTGNPK